MEFKNFHHGASPVAHLNALTEVGNEGHYSVGVDINVLTPGILTQGPGLANLTNGTDAGAMAEAINFIMDRPAADGQTYGMGPTRLFRIGTDTLTSGGSPSWPRSITSAADGESCVEFFGRLKYFYNTSSAGDFGDYDLASTFDDDYGSTVPTGAGALENAPHPCAKKEDILVFGNGRYFGTFVNSITTLSRQKLDFGTNTQVADVAFHANQWWIAVNEGIAAGTNRMEASLYLYDGAAIDSILFDQVGIGVHRIGWILPMNGVVYVCWRDLTNSINYVGFVNGRRLEVLGAFTGNLPTYEKKTIYQNFILFVSSGSIFAIGSAHPDFPVALSQLADGGETTDGGLAAPFGTPMIASVTGSTRRIATFSGRVTTSDWRSIVIPTVDAEGNYGFIDKIVVLTNNLGSGASCALTVQANQAQTTSSTMTINTTDRRRHVFTSRDINLGARMEDFRIRLDWSGGSTANPVDIRRIFVKGHYISAGY